MNLNNLIFIDSLPRLDLHGLDRDTARVAILDFINDNYKMKKQFITIIHGNGSGILKQVTKDTLSKHKKVIESKIFYYNTGCTIVHIDTNKS